MFLLVRNFHLCSVKQGIAGFGYYADFARFVTSRVLPAAAQGARDGEAACRTSRVGEEGRAGA